MGNVLWLVYKLGMNEVVDIDSRRRCYTVTEVEVSSVLHIENRCNHRNSYQGVNSNGSMNPCWRPADLDDSFTKHNPRMRDVLNLGILLGMISCLKC